MHDAVDNQPEPRRIVALIPAYNAAPTVGDVVTGASVHLPVLVVDDGSTDATAARAEEAGATVLRQTPNQGKGMALRTGFHWALDHGYAAVLTLDADMQHDPAEIPKFVERFRQTNAELIIGERDFSQMPFIRRLSNTIGRRAFSWAMGQPIRDNQSGYRLLGRGLIESLRESAEHGFEFEMDMIVIALKRGDLLEWVPIRTIYGDAGSHIRPLQHVVNFFRMVRRTRRAIRAP